MQAFFFYQKGKCLKHWVKEKNTVGFYLKSDLCKCTLSSSSWPVLSSKCTTTSYPSSSSVFLTYSDKSVFLSPLLSTFQTLLLTWSVWFPLSLLHAVQTICTFKVIIVRFSLRAWVWFSITVHQIFCKTTNTDCQLKSTTHICKQLQTTAECLCISITEASWDNNERCILDTILSELTWTSSAV